MTLEKYVEWLYEVATGWLHWSDDQAMNTNIERIRLAHEGQCDLLTQIFGEGKSSKGMREIVDPKDKVGIGDLLHRLAPPKKDG